MTSRTLRSAFPWLLLAVVGLASFNQDEVIDEPTGPQVQYLEFVTPEVDATCATYAAVHGVTFGDPVAELGNARTAALAGGGMIGVRAPMRDSEPPMIRAYLLVDDIDAAAKAAAEAGGEMALPPMEIPGGGKFAIYLQGGINHSLWQL